MINKILSIILLLQCIAILSSCSEPIKKSRKIIKLDSVIYKPGTKELFNGTWKGDIDSFKIEFGVVNGKKEGNFRTYYPNGSLMMSGQMKNNRNEGEWKYFYENGTVESAGIFKNDKPEGKWSWYYPDSTLKQTGYFHLGERDSIWKSYDSTGTMFDSTFIDSALVDSTLQSDSTIRHLPL